MSVVENLSANGQQRVLASGISRIHLLIVLVAVVLPCAVGANAQQAEREFVNAVCHLSFRHPTSWIVQRDTTQAERPCFFQVRAAAYDSLLIATDSLEDISTIRIEVMAFPFEEVLPMSAFERRDGGWIVGGRVGLENPATPIADRRWRGVRGDAPVGCYRLEGGYVGACEVPMALIGVGSFTAKIEGGPQTWDEFDRLLATFDLQP